MITDKPLISVVIPLYNKESTIKHTLNSVLVQTFQDFEIVIINDGSKDKSANVVSSISDHRIRLVNQENGGVSAARNKGIKEAHGKYIAFLDADDEWTPKHLSSIASLIEKYKGEASIFTTNFVRAFPSGKTYVNRSDITTGVIDNYFKQVRKGSLINSSTACVLASLFKSVGGFKEKYSMGEDIDMWNRLARISKVAYSELPTSIYHIDSTSNSRTSKINYSKDAAQDALMGVSRNPYDILNSLTRLLKFHLKRFLRYQPKVKEPL